MNIGFGGNCCSGEKETFDTLARSSHTKIINYRRSRGVEAATPTRRASAAIATLISYLFFVRVEFSVAQATEYIILDVFGCQCHSKSINLRGFELVDVRFFFAGARVNRTSHGISIVWIDAAAVDAAARWTN